MKQNPSRRVRRNPYAENDHFQRFNVALLRVRNAIIQQAGYAVLTSKESAMVLEMAAKDHVGAVVLCSSIPGTAQGKPGP
jgi:hypothetical protein